MDYIRGWQPGMLWAAVEMSPPYRLIGLYPTQEYAVARAMEFGSAAQIQPILGLDEAKCLVGTLIRLREGR